MTRLLSIVPWPVVWYQRQVLHVLLHALILNHLRWRLWEQIHVCLYGFYCCLLLLAKYHPIEWHLVILILHPRNNILRHSALLIWLNMLWNTIMCLKVAFCLECLVHLLINHPLSLCRLLCPSKCAWRYLSTLHVPIWYTHNELIALLSMTSGRWSSTWPHRLKLELSL